MGTDRSAPRDTVLQSPPSPPPSVASSPSSSSSPSSLQSSPSSSLLLLLVAVVVAIVAAVTVVVVELEWQQGRRLAITPAAAVMGATAVAFGTCVAMILAVGHSAGAGEVVVMSRRLLSLSIVHFKFPDAQRAQPRAATNPHCRPAVDNSKTVSTTTTTTTTKTTTKTTTIATSTTATRRHDELDGHQLPPPPGSCHRQWQGDINNSNNATANDNDNDGSDDNDDNTDNNDKTMTTGHEINWTRRLGRDGEFCHGHSHGDQK
ncbi:hypothetical protein EDB89DRAFT_1907923 [Lactarius sanguifluus]|nr:hypothetical protein EDB89DRAFT_1907923 [Lactarius sanguifluus]